MKHRPDTLPLLSLLFVLLAPLSSQATELSVPYSCDNGSRVDIAFSADSSGRPQATLHFADAALTLPQVPVASGTLYRQGDIRLHSEGDEAVFEDGKGNRRRCLRGMSAPPSSQVAPSTSSSSFINIRGQVSYRSRIALPANAILTIRIENIGRAGGRRQTLVEQRYELNGAQVPIPFSASVDRDLLGKKAQLTASARIETGGRLRYVSDRRYPVLDHGQPIAVDILLKPVAKGLKH